MKRLFGIVGWSGSGKMSLIERLIPTLKTRGISVSTIKHAHHDVDLDRPGKDTYIHRTAGAEEVLLVTENRFALMRELSDEPMPSLDRLVDRLAPVDIVLIEGFKRTAMPKLEIHRPALNKPPSWTEDATVTAVASDTALPQCDRPVLALADTEAICDLVAAAALPADAIAGPAEWPTGP